MKWLFAGSFAVLVALSCVAWSMKPEATATGKVPLLWVSDDNPARRQQIDLFNKLNPQYDLRLDPNNQGMEKVIVQSIAGAGPWTVFWDIALLLARPGLIALAVFTFMGNYGSFFWPLILIKSDHLRTLPIGMLYFDSVYGKQTNLIMAASVMNLLPLIILFVVSQKFLVRGIQMGGVKG